MSTTPLSMTSPSVRPPGPSQANPRPAASQASSRLAKPLAAYGVFLFSVAVAAVIYNPSTNQFGFNAAAKTALISGGVCGGLSLVWAFLLSRGLRWPVYGALGTTGLFLAAFLWRSTVAWKAVAAGATEKWYAGSLITLMAIASVTVLGILGRHLLARRRLQRR